MCYNYIMRIREGWEKEGNKLILERWFTIDELILQPWYDEYIAPTSFMQTILNQDLNGEVRIVYELDLEKKTGEYALSLYGDYVDLDEELIDFKNDPVEFEKFMKKYVYEEELEK